MTGRKRGALNVAGMHIGGRYRLEALLGRGGMGEVWRAHDPRLDRKVAIKFLPPDLADGHVVDRFHREARVTARLQHPGITQVFDSGAQDGRLHLVMELLDGRDLGSVLQDGKSGLPVRRAVDLAAQVAEALSYAHRADIVHRDIKPANLMLVDGGRVKVCDFGIAGFVHADSGLTREGSLMGTPDYMAPEQCRGLRVDGRADLYALGCVLFALLTGRPPFTTHGDFRVVMMDHIHTPPRGWPPCGRACPSSSTGSSRSCSRRSPLTVRPTPGSWPTGSETSPLGVPGCRCPRPDRALRPLPPLDRIPGTRTPAARRRLLAPQVSRWRRTTTRCSTRRRPRPTRS